MFVHKGKPIFVALAIVALTLAISPLAGAQEGPQPVKVEFTAYEGNPILTVGEAGAWDSGIVFTGNVLYNDGKFHMLYAGGTEVNATPAIGYATSEDGLHWTKYEDNPVLEMDPTITKAGIFWMSPVFDGENWTVFFSFAQYRGSPTTSIMRATAPDPTGPWTIDAKPLLEKGSGQDWDSPEISVVSVAKDKGGYALYYNSQGVDVGRATSLDGITWTKYNNPTTIEPKFANSDPVFTVGEAGSWDRAMVAGNIVQYGDHGWEMFYGGADDNTYSFSVGYATSEDGIAWTHFGDGPVLIPPEGYVQIIPTSFVIVDGTYYLYYAMSPAVDTWNQMGVATGTVTWK